MLFHDIGLAYGVALYIIVAPSAVALIAHFFIFPPKKEDNPLFGNLFFPLLTVSVVFFTGGLFSKYLGDYISGIASMISLGVGLLIIYVILRVYIRPPKWVDMKNYLAVMLTFLPFIGLYQLFVKIVAKVDENVVIEDVQKPWGPEVENA